MTGPGPHLKRQSIPPTYDHRQTGDRFTVATRVNGRPIGETLTRDPFVNHRVTVGWPDLLRALLHRRLVVEVLVSGDHGIVEDVSELDSDYLGFNCTRRDEWNAHVQGELVRISEGSQ